MILTGHQKQKKTLFPHLTTESKVSPSDKDQASIEVKTEEIQPVPKIEEGNIPQIKEEYIEPPDPHSSTSKSSFNEAESAISLIIREFLLRVRKDQIVEESTSKPSSMPKPSNSGRVAPSLIPSVKIQPRIGKRSLPAWPDFNQLTKQIKTNNQELYRKLLEIPTKTTGNRVPASKRERKPRNKRISMSQNYKGVITRGFGRMIMLSHENKGTFYDSMRKMVEKMKIKYNYKHSEDYLYQKFIKYVKDFIQGKKLYKTKFDRPADLSKVSTSDQITEAFFARENDAEDVKILKDITQSMFLHFLDSDGFSYWLLRYCQSTFSNKIFLLMNREEIRKVFNSPIYLKIKFVKSEVSVNLSEQLNLEVFLKTILVFAQFYVLFVKS